MCDLNKIVIMHLLVSSAQLIVAETSNCIGEVRIRDMLSLDNYKWEVIVYKRNTKSFFIET